VACGAFHTAAVTESGRVYTWGKEEYGTLGHDVPPDKITDAQVG
jgi:alpha-tubulin suppressor-like RCC1 family protein